MSSTAAVQAQPPLKPKRNKKSVGRERKLERRIEAKPDGRYLIYYKPR